MRRTSNSRIIRKPALDRSRTCRTRRSYQPVWTRPQQPQTVFLSADRGARSPHPDHRIHHVRSLSLESLRTNIHPTAAAVASSIRPSLSVPKSSSPPSLRKPLSTSISAAMIPQNHPLDSLKTLNNLAHKTIPERDDIRPVAGANSHNICRIAPAVKSALKPALKIACLIALLGLDAMPTCKDQRAMKRGPLLVECCLPLPPSW